MAIWQFIGNDKSAEPLVKAVKDDHDFVNKILDIYEYKDVIPQLKQAFRSVLTNLRSDKVLLALVILSLCFLLSPSG